MSWFWTLGIKLLQYTFQIIAIAIHMQSIICTLSLSILHVYTLHLYWSPTILLIILPEILFMAPIILRDEYRTMKWQWQSMTKTQEQNFSEFRERKHLIGKDNMKSIFFVNCKQVQCMLHKSVYMLQGGKICSRVESVFNVG